MILINTPHSQLSRYWAIVLLTIVLYVVVFFPLYSLRGIGTLAMSAAPVLAAGWGLGRRAGLLIGLLIFPLNTVLMNMVGELGWDVVFRNGGGVGSVAAVLVGLVVGTLHDLSNRLKQELDEHKQAKEALQASEERFRIVTEGSLAGVYIIQDDKFLYVNPTLAYIFGYHPEEMIGRMGPLDVTHSDSRARVVEMVQERVSRKIEAAQYTFTGLRKNGTSVECEVLGRYVDYRGQPAIIGTLLDITERQRVQEELVKAERLQAELEKEKELNELKSRFVSMISHEFRTPLAVILASSDILSKYNHRLNDARKMEHLQQIQAKVYHLDMLLDTILNIGKAEAVGINFQPAVLDFKNLCSNLIQEVQLTTPDHELRFAWEGDYSDVSVDRKLMRQALANLLSNAIKYSPRGGPIDLRLSRNDCEMTITIQDRGIGIPQEDQKRLFELFHRAQNVADIPGTGLGLSLIKQVVEAHNGSISFESQIGVGTTFTVVLPLAQGIHHGA